MGRRKRGLSRSKQQQLATVLNAVAQDAKRGNGGRRRKRGLTAAEQRQLATVLSAVAGEGVRGKRRGRRWTDQDGTGKPQKATQEEVTFEQLRQRVRAAQRARRVPWLVAAGIAAAGSLAWAVSAVLEASGVLPGVATAALAAAVSAVVALIVVIAKRKVERRWRRRVRLVALAAPMWVFVAAAAGVGVLLLAVLVAGTGLVSAGWWRAHRPSMARGTELVLAARKAVVVEGPLEEVAREWARGVASGRGPVANSRLTDGEILERAMRFTIETVPGSVEFVELFNRRAKIASALRRRVVDIQLDPHPTRREDLAQLTIITENVLEKGVPYTGPQYNDGRIPIGPFDDGEGWAEIVVTDSAGCYCLAVTGEPRSGKSACFEAVGLALRSSGRWLVPYCDGDPTGGSSPLMNECMNWALAGPEGALRQLAAMEAWLELRGMQKNMLTEGPGGLPIPLVDERTQRPARKILPCPDFPGIMWMIDELHRLTGDEGLRKLGFVERLEALVRVGPKYGLVVATATQSLLMPDYGNSTPLRAFLSARNLIAFRNTNKTEVAVINGLNIPPFALPPGGGYAYTTAGGRLAMLRAAWSENMTQFGAKLPDVDLGEDGRLAVSELWTGEKPDPQKMITQARADLQAWRAHRITGGAKRRQLEPATAGGAGSAFAGATATITKLRAGIPAPLTANNVVPIGAAGGLSAEARELRDLIASGRLADAEGLTKRAPMMDATNWDKNKIAKVLNELEAAKVIESPKQGFYRLTRPAAVGQPA